MKLDTVEDCIKAIKPYKYKIKSFESKKDIAACYAVVIPLIAKTSDLDIGYIADAFSSKSDEFLVDVMTGV